MILPTATLIPGVSTPQSARKWVFGIEAWEHHPVRISLALALARAHHIIMLLAFPRVCYPILVFFNLDKMETEKYNLAIVGAGEFAISIMNMIGN
jgi:hypothetical protein